MDEATKLVDNVQTTQQTWRKKRKFQKLRMQHTSTHSPLKCEFYRDPPDEALTTHKPAFPTDTVRSDDAAMSSREHG